MSIHNPSTAYDFTAALTNLSDKIQELSNIKQQQQGAPGLINQGLRAWRRNKSSLLCIFTMYSISTAVVLEAMFSANRLKSDQQSEAHMQQQLQQQIDRLKQQAQRQQHMLDSLRIEVQQYKGSWLGNGKFKQQLLDTLQHWRLREVEQEGPDSPELQRTKQADEAPQADKEFGVRVGKLGQGFII